jgi:uncharacterized delta-60 repeat protein
MMQRARNILFARTAIATCASLASCAAFGAGELDPDFGDGGRARIDIGGSVDSANAIAHDAAGNLYIAGSSGGNSTRDFAVLALDASGTPISAFGDGGKVVLDLGGVDVASSIARDASGNLFVAGTTGASDFVVVKLDASGHPVAGFGSGGTKVVDAGGFDQCWSVLLDASGNVYLVGGSTAAPGSTVVAKLDASGNLVANYGSGGIATAPSRADFSGPGAIDAAGRIIATGFSSFGPTGGGSLVVTRIEANGQPSTAFGDNGVADIYIPFGSANTETDPGGIVIDANGSIFIAAYTDANEDRAYDLAAIKLDGDGHLVSGFGEGGIAVVAQPGSYDLATGIALDASGHVYIAGASSNDDGTRFLVAALDASGALLGSFAGGVVPIAFDETAYANAIAITGGRVYVAGMVGFDALDFGIAALVLGTSDDVLFRNGFDFQ